ncbi:ropporin-1-like protein isoform X5 [Perca flavescens]|uniref:ropporin-1-like protein isoform X5 n=1 Tax=Perca flavescens TaxID=8167 RepID=UPI00106E6131|nr:ropporin-1-like protein isoform X5 [Perca flavescens]
MPLPDTMYCAQQINIPPQLPDILKNFTKAAIRTQPKDLLLWSAAYFSALSKGECLPVKDRLEMNVATQKTDTGLSPGLLKILHKQLSPRETCSKEELQKKWKGLCLPMDQLETLLSLGSFGSDINWMEFFALGCSALGGRMTRVALLVSRSTPLANSTPTWLTWTGTCHRITLTTSSAAYRHKRNSNMAG